MSSPRRMRRFSSLGHACTRAIVLWASALAACGRPTERARPVPDEPGAAAMFKSAWSENPPCYVPNPDARPSRFDGADGQFHLHPCPPDAGSSDAVSPEAGHVPPAETR